MLRIRLTQRGKKHQRSYRIIVVDSHKPRDTNDYLDDLGYWNRIKKEFKLDRKKYEVWVNKGAQPTDAIRHRYEKDSNLNRKLSKTE